MMRNAVRLAVGCVGICLLCSAVEGAEQTVELPAEEFLRLVRRPLQQDLWARISGTIVRMDKAGKRKAQVKLGIVFGPNANRAEILLDDRNYYELLQQHSGDAAGKAELSVPEDETGVSLAELGVEPEDVTLAFIYWDFVTEGKRESFRRQPCRVMVLEHPEGKGYVKVWFAVREGFPLKAEWYKPAATECWRTLEFKGAKKHKSKFWFVKEMRLEGEDWKTQVAFQDVDLFTPDEEPVPESFFDKPEVTPDAAPEKP